MDPDQCYDDFLEALRDGDTLVASHRLDDLARWVRSGGFVPAKLAARNLPTDILIRLLSSAAAVLHLAALDINPGDQP